VPEDVGIRHRARLDDGREIEALRIRVADRLLHARRLAHRREDRVETPDPVAQPLEVGLRARRIDLLLEVLERRRYDGERRPELVRKLARERLQILRVLAKPLEQIREAARQSTEDRKSVG